MAEWWRHAVIYQIYPRSFQDDRGQGVGTLAGITARLDHVASLGVDAIWLSPFFTSPQKDMGYDVSDYCDVDPLFGTLADFDAMVAKAHGLGLKVVIDQVLSHSSDKHEWFSESRMSRTNPKADWYVWADPKPDGSPPNNWISHFGGPAWEWEPRRRQFYLHNFLAEQPDLNFYNPDVQDALLAAMRFWLDRGVDGFRLDTVNYYFHDKALRDNPAKKPEGDTTSADLYGWQDAIHSKTQAENIDFLGKMRALTNEYGARMLMGEVGESGERAVQVMGAYTADDDKLHMAYSFDMLSPEFSARHFRRGVGGFLEQAPSGWPCWSFSNHDVVRHVSRWSAYDAGDDALAKLSIALLASLPGTLCLYQGEELGQTESDLEYAELTDPPGLRFWPETKGRDGCRTPMVWEKDAPHAGFTTGTPWLPVKAPQAARAVDEMEEKPGSILHHYRAVLHFRGTLPALLSPETKWLDLPEPLLGIRRGAGRDAVIGVFNLSASTQRIALAGIGGRLGPSIGCEISDEGLELAPNGFGWLSIRD